MPEAPRLRSVEDTRGLFEALQGCDVESILLADGRELQPDERRLGRMEDLASADAGADFIAGDVRVVQPTPLRTSRLDSTGRVPLLFRRN